MRATTGGRTYLAHASVTVRPSHEQRGGGEVQEIDIDAKEMGVRRMTAVGG